MALYHFYMCIAQIIHALLMDDFLLIYEKIDAK